jgi:hypothetical protein
VTAIAAGSGFHEKSIGSGFASLGHSFEAKQHGHAGSFHLLDSVQAASEVARTTRFDG